MCVCVRERERDGYYLCHRRLMLLFSAFGRTLDRVVVCERERWISFVS